MAKRATGTGFASHLEEGETVEKPGAIRSWPTEHGYRIAQVTLQFADYEWNDAYCRCRAKQDQAAIARLKQSYLDAAAEDIALGRRRAIGSSARFQM